MALLPSLQEVTINPKKILLSLINSDEMMIDMELTELFRDPNYIKYYSFYTR